MECEEYSLIKRLVGLYDQFKGKIADYKVIDICLDKIPSFGLKIEEIQFADEIEDCLNSHYISQDALFSEAIKTLKDKLDYDF